MGKLASDQPLRVAGYVGRPSGHLPASGPRAVRPPTGGRAPASWAATRIRAVVSPTRHLDITAALALLPLRQRLAVVLYYLDDRSISQVASLMGVSEGTVNRHLFRAREALRSYLKEA